MTIVLSVIDKQSMVVGTIAARVGLHTTAGRITRMSEKSVWCQRKDGPEWCFRAYDGRLPSVPKWRAPKAEIRWSEQATG